MITSLMVDWCEAGALGIYDLAPPTREDARLRKIWVTDQGFVHLDILHGHTPRLFVPTFFNTDPEQIVLSIANLEYEATRLGLQNATLVFVTRDCHFQVEGEPVQIVYGMVLLEGEDAIPNTEPVENGEDAARLIIEWLRGVRGVNVTEMHAVHRGIFVRAMQRREERSAWWLAEQEKERKAGVRARILLVGCLDEEQRREFEEHKRFHLRSADGRLFRIKDGHSYNVVWIDEEDGEPIASYCVVTSVWCPVYDQMLAQKLMLETDPDAFFALANRQVMRLSRLEAAA